jgi:predicted transcriptional regulator
MKPRSLWATLLRCSGALAVVERPLLAAIPGSPIGSNIEEKKNMASDRTHPQSELLALTTEIVTAHLSNNPAPSSEVPGLIQTVFDTLSMLANEKEPIPTVLTPAVPIRRSVTDEYIVCLEDGKKLKLLKQHLMTAYGMTPEQYRAKWGLPHDYPMTAPSYSRRRQELAKAIGLGRKPGLAPEPPTRRRPKARAA